jgi:hypothetical protein
MSYTTRKPYLAAERATEKRQRQEPLSSSPPPATLGVEKPKEHLVTYGVQLFADYAEKNNLGPPLKVIYAEGGPVTGLGIACLWEGRFRTAINVKWNFYAEAKEIERRMRAMIPS